MTLVVPICGRMILPVRTVRSLKIQCHIRVAALFEKRMPAAIDPEGFDAPQDAVGIFFGRDVAERERIGGEQIRRHQRRVWRPG